MYSTIKRLEEVWTKDDYRLGVARSLHFRPEEQVNVGEQLFGVYLEVESYDLGDAFFVPVDYIEGRDPDKNAVIVGVTMKEVMDRTWTRMPEFVARQEGREELLASDGKPGAPDPV